jgi:malonyl-CoA/methylmalonyl-CoA synthetase
MAMSGADDRWHPTMTASSSSSRNHLIKSFAAGFSRPKREFAKLPDGSRVTYGDLSRMSGRFAHVFTALGANPGDRIVVQTEKCIDFLCAYLASIRLGAVFVPLNPAYTQAEMAYFLADAEPAVFVCETNNASDENRTRIPGCAVVSLAELSAAANDMPTEFEDAIRIADDLAAILYTSGTTGRSKGAMLTHDNLASNARTLVAAWRIGEDDVLLHALPLFHIHGLFVATNTLLVAGASMLFLPKFDLRAVLDAMKHATLMMGVPTFYTRLLQTPELSPELTGHIRLFVSGSAPLLAETHREWESRTGHVLLERYGMTETGMITSNPYEGERIAGTVGPPLPGVDVRIAGADANPDAIGVIEVQGPNVFKGYWRMPEKTAEEFRPDGFFITGDLGMIDAQGYVHIVGRDKDLVISGGFNVYPKEIEGRIDEIEGVLESAVIGVPHPDFGEAVTAVVVLKPGTELDEKSVLRKLETHLAPFKRPKRVFFVNELPRNAMGKVQKNVLKATYGQTPPPTPKARISAKAE